MDLEALLAAHRGRIRTLAGGRMHIPSQEPFVEGHNTWCVNRPGSDILMPVEDVTQHHLLTLCFPVQNGFCMMDDVHREKIPGLDRFRHLVDVDNPGWGILSRRGRKRMRDASRSHCTDAGWVKREGGPFGNSVAWYSA